VHKFSKNIGNSSKFGAPAGWHSASSVLMIRKYKFPPYKVSRQGDLAPRTCVALAYIHINALHYRCHHHHHRRRRRRRHVVCLTTGSQPLPKRVRHTVRSTASSFNVQYFLISMLSSSYLRLLSHLSVRSVFPSITCFRTQFLHTMWPIYLAFLCFTVCRIFLSPSTLCNICSFFYAIGPTDLLHPSPAPHFKTF